MMHNEIVAQVRVADNERKMQEIERYHRLRADISPHRPGLIRRTVHALAVRIPTASRRQPATFDRLPAGTPVTR